MHRGATVAQAGERSATIDANEGGCAETAELTEKLVALVPAPRANLVRYHGTLAPNARLRAVSRALLTFGGGSQVSVTR